MHSDAALAARLAEAAGVKMVQHVHVQSTEMNVMGNFDHGHDTLRKISVKPKAKPGALRLTIAFPFSDAQGSSTRARSATLLQNVPPDTLRSF